MNWDHYLIYFRTKVRICQFENGLNLGYKIEAGMKRATQRVAPTEVFGIRINRQQEVLSKSAEGYGLTASS